MALYYWYFTRDPTSPTRCDTPSLVTPHYVRGISFSGLPKQLFYAISFHKEVPRPSAYRHVPNCATVIIGEGQKRVTWGDPEVDRAVWPMPGTKQIGPPRTNIT